jgi:hypothetical protein
MSTPTNRRGRPRIEDPLLVTTLRLPPEQKFYFTNYVGGERTRAWIDSLIEKEGPEMREYLRQMREERLHRQE